MRALAVALSALALIAMVAMGGFTAGVVMGERRAEAGFCSDEESPRYIPDPEVQALVCD